jgi:hypothetical protein
VISAAENSNKIPKNHVFWKEKSVEDVVTHEPTAQATLILVHDEIQVQHQGFFGLHFVR